MRGSRTRNIHEARDKRCAPAGPTTSPPVLINLSRACYASLHILRVCDKYIERLLRKRVDEERGKAVSRSDLALV